MENFISQGNFAPFNAYPSKQRKRPSEFEDWQQWSDETGYLDKKYPTGQALVKYIRQTNTEQWSGLAQVVGYLAWRLVRMTNAEEQIDKKRKDAIIEIYDTLVEQGFLRLLSWAANDNFSKVETYYGHPLIQELMYGSPNWGDGSPDLHLQMVAMHTLCLWCGSKFKGKIFVQATDAQGTPIANQYEAKNGAAAQQIIQTVKTNASANLTWLRNNQKDWFYDGILDITDILKSRKAFGPEPAALFLNVVKEFVPVPQPITYTRRNGTISL